MCTFVYRYICAVSGDRTKGGKMEGARAGGRVGVQEGGDLRERGDGNLVLPWAGIVFKQIVVKAHLRLAVKR